MKYLYIVVGALLPTISLASQSGEDTLKNSSVMTTQGLLNWVLSTFAVLGIILVVAYVLKKVRFMPSATKGINIVSQVSVGPKERVLQLKLADDRQILIGVTAHNVNFLCELNSSEMKGDKGNVKSAKETFESIMNEQTQTAHKKESPESSKNDAEH
ncbi:Flagellar protein fliO [Anaerobiospirillum thomasii]|uniref:Flagellar protein fliO n=2 Tax=Gammaproteobacteria TaxID=1236 RepID=A0A2X0WTS9_9GAMM|nr:flagellar biosynthetic protein FliO [Anaerobiospirillum thomasii]SPT69932.1 Flagellar protein fliO [Anaerobiospirillum thomasii]SPT71420.1 Flagellar protein fliO [Anaerobiospirillum thomasii]